MSRPARRESVLSARRGVKALLFLALTASVTGCNGCLARELSAWGPHPLDGAKLVAPASATAGERITLDASGGEIDKR